MARSSPVIPTDKIPSDLTARQVAHICSVTERCVRNWALRKIIPGGARLGGVWRFDAAQFWAWRDLEQSRSHRSASDLAGLSPATGSQTFVNSDLKLGRTKSDGRLERLLGLPRPSEGGRRRPGAQG